MYKSGCIDHFVAIKQSKNETRVLVLYVDGENRRFFLCKWSTHDFWYFRKDMNFLTISVKNN